MGHNIGWFVGLLAIGWSLGATIVWVKMNETVSRLRFDLGKCLDEKGQLLANVSALDDELDDLEAENGDLRALRIVCDTCLHEVPRWMDVQTVFSGKGRAMYKCEGCGRREDMECLKLDFPALEESN